MESEKSHICCLQTRGPEKPVSFIQSKSAGPRTRGAKDVTPSARMAGREWSSLLPLFIPFGALTDWGGGSLPSSLLHMLMSPTNTLEDTLRNHVESGPPRAQSVRRTKLTIITEERSCELVQQRLVSSFS